MQINFNNNWNSKLNQHIFTTIRNHTNEKEKYYKSLINQLFDINLNDNITGKAYLKNVWVEQYSNIPFPLIAIDTGIIKPIKNMKLFEKFGMKDSNSKMIILTFEKYNHKE